MSQFLDFLIVLCQCLRGKQARPSDADSFYCPMSTHYAVAAAGASGEATEGCPFGGVRKCEFALFAPVALNRYNSSVNAQHSNRERNL